MVGDPAGIGPEVAVKALAGGAVHEVSIPVLLGSAAAVERAVAFTGVAARIRVMRTFEKPSDDPSIIDVLDTGALPPGVLPLGEDTEAAGLATAQWLDELDALARDGSFAATIMGPISTGSLKLAGKLHKVISPTPGESYLVLLTGPLRVTHLTDHMSLRQVIDVISIDLVATAISQLDTAMKGWGIAQPRIAVAGLNPHAGEGGLMGDEELRIIAPAIAAARAAGIDARGPFAPDTVFMRARRGAFDLVVAMTHDHGLIPIKYLGIEQGVNLTLGLPFVRTSPDHGTAFDIAGGGSADPSSLEAAIRRARAIVAARAGAAGTR
jgi:4-hydroxythreonine-4-phosphate dehydrogenase